MITASAAGGAATWAAKAPGIFAALLRVSLGIAMFSAAIVIIVVVAALFGAERRAYGRLLYLIQTVASIFTGRVRPNLKLIEEFDTPEVKIRPSAYVAGNPYDGILEDLQSALTELEAANQRHKTALTALQMVLIQGGATKEHADMLAELLSTSETRREPAEPELSDRGDAESPHVG
ncbi:hypothetical protein [Sphaerisporangium dianthi]|uniref:Uncharacterized protein n=1 Tax=Sphaerisporangium dianthi TaxID=1436120 RepID=A0ABV9CBC8_9ACTN